MNRSPQEILSERFYAWERRGRGWWSFPYPVSLEPPFRPFPGHYLAETHRDDGRRPSWLGSLLGSLRNQRAEPEESDHDEEPEPEPAEEGGDVIELALLPPKDLSVTPALAAAWLRSLAGLSAPASFELVGSKGRVAAFLTTQSDDVSRLSSQVRAFFPKIVVEEGQDLLLDTWEEGKEGVFSVVEFGLAREFMLPLASPRSFSPDPLTAVVAALGEARFGEVALVQVLFQAAAAPWTESVLRSVVTKRGDPFFPEAPEITKFAREKVSAPLYAVAVRAAARAASEERLWTLLRGILGALAGASSGDNELVPLGGGDLASLLADVLLRRTHRSGMLLSLPELLSLVHPPSESVEGLVREGGRTKALPSEACGEGVLLGENLHQGLKREARLSTDARMRHVHVLGASGTGKSTLLVSLILQDIAAGHGVGVIDPHGDLVDEVLARFPEERTADLILFDPADPEYAVGWNMLSASSEAEKDMLASDLVAVFRRLSTSWGDQMTALLSNAVISMLESERGGTLLDLRRLLVDPAWRKSFLETVRDPYARDFWTTEFPMLSGKPQGPILTRLDTLLRSRLVRGVVTGGGKPLDFRRVLDDGRIFLGRLSQGAIGEENAALLGSLLVSKVHQVSLLRQDRPEGERRPFFLYLDEFHNLATPSMAALFSGARKYRLSVTVAHQDLYQLRKTVPEVERAVLANAYTRIAFRLGEEDARTLAAGFSFFTPDDLGNLGTGEAICRIGRKEHDFNLATARLDSLDGEEVRERRRILRSLSLKRWGVLRSEDAGPLPAVVPERPRLELISPRKEKEKERPEEGQPVQARPMVPAARESEVEKLPPPPQAAKEAPAEPRRSGKGGAEHTYLQELVKRWAEERGFRAVIEEQIAGGRESIDVALYRGDTRIACEVSVTTPLAYEVGNVEKCLAAGFGMVAVVSLKKGRLQKFDKLLSESLPPEKRERVHLFTPEELLAWLAGQPAEVQEGVVGGYKVKVRYQAPKDARSERVAQILARSMSRLQKEESGK